MTRLIITAKRQGDVIEMRVLRLKNGKKVTVKRRK
jgi:hypothetical protein